MTSQSRFSGVAGDYARFRPGYPAALFELLRTRYGLDEESRVLDLAAGTGLLALPLARIVGEVVALDLDAGMLAQLEAVAPPNVRTVVGRAEELGPELGRFRLTTIGRAFHWLERDTVLERLHELSEGVAITGDPTPPGEPWETVSGVVAEFVGDRRPKHSGESWGEVVARSPYGSVEEHAIEVERRWTLDEVVGYTFSLSWAARKLFGDRAAEFERELRARLGPGPWVERATFEVWLAP